MGTEMTKGTNFGASATVTHTNLNNLVDNAVIEKGAITSRTEVTTLEDDDMFLVYDDSATDIKKVKRIAVARASESAPSGASSNGTKGDVAMDTGYLYVCTVTGTPGTWKRMALDITSW